MYESQSSGTSGKIAPHAGEQTGDPDRARAGLSLSVAKLVRLKEDHPAVLKVYRHGLTAEVFHLKVEGHHWCLKRRRHDSLVANVDGRTAFLTELERRREIEALRELHPTILANVVCTCFGSARAGVLVSPGCGACRCMN